MAGIAPMAKTNAKSKKLDPATKEYISALKSENLKLQKLVAKLEAKDLSNKNKIKALAKQAKHGGPVLNINMEHPASI
jgi:hypothetical protein